MYSIDGSCDYSTVSPSPLTPTFPVSQPVTKIYLEKQGGFSSASKKKVSTISKTQVHPANLLPSQTPLDLGIQTQRVFRSLAVFCHGFLAGLAFWQVITVYVLHDDDLSFISLYSPLSQPLHLVFYLLTVICTVSVCDRYDIAQFDLSQLQKLVTFQSGGLVILVYSCTLILTLVTTRMDDKLSLHQHNATLFEDMEEEDLAWQIQTWKILNLTRWANIKCIKCTYFIE